MPDRYGEQPDADEQPAARKADAILAAAAIARCHLCDTDGYRGTSVCDHIDHRPAAARGMAKVRAAMGWDR